MIIPGIKNGLFNLVVGGAADEFEVPASVVNTVRSIEVLGDVFLSQAAGIAITDEGRISPICRAGDIWLRNGAIDVVLTPAGEVVQMMPAFCGLPKNADLRAAGVPVIDRECDFRGFE